ncbi:MAG: sulfite exporter TauE/SafE family protein [Gammaproteobacteria bacterium]|nr:sulfite exporter TauE/SafE family protein [Gammaproteobacteria bacterium]
MFSLLFLGLLIGMRHALEADHVAALASLTSNNQSIKDTVKHGAVWGLGHTITLFIFGGVMLLVGRSISDQLVHVLEFSVGVMLVVLGIDVLRKLIKKRIHFHHHQHENEQHFHAHSHEGEKHQQHNPENHQHEHGKAFPLRALFVGLMHGMAGSAALIVLTLQTVSSTTQGVLYILFFGIGSIFGMASLSFIIAIPLRRSAQGLTWMHNGFQGVIGLATIVIGGMLMLENTPLL